MAAAVAALLVGSCSDGDIEDGVTPTDAPPESVLDGMTPSSGPTPEASPETPAARMVPSESEAPPSSDDVTMSTTPLEAPTELPRSQEATDGPDGQVPDSLRATPPGSYVYRQTGTATTSGDPEDISPTGTLTVDPETATGRQSRRRTLDDGESVEHLEFSFTGGGIFLDRFSMEMTGPMAVPAISCSFVPGVAAPAWPPSPGWQTTAQADCGSIDVTLTVRVTGDGTAEIDGGSRKVSVIDFTVEFSGAMSGLVEETQHFDGRSALPLTFHRKTDVTMGFSTYSSDVTGELTTLDV